MKKLTLLLALLNATCVAQKRDTIKCILLVCDTNNVNTNASYWIWGLDVRELHNTSEGVNDAGICPMCYEDYWRHKKYLRRDKKEIPPNIIIWQSK